FADSAGDPRAASAPVSTVRDDRYRFLRADRREYGGAGARRRAGWTPLRLDEGAALLPRRRHVARGRARAARRRRVRARRRRRRHPGLHAARPRPPAGRAAPRGPRPATPADRGLLGRLRLRRVSAARFGIATGAFEHERDDWDAAVAKAAAGGWRCLELTAITEERLDALVPFLRTSPAALDPFARVSLHAPVRLRTSLPAVVETLVSLDHGFDVVLHPDVYRAEPSLDRLASRLVFENMDVQKSFGRGVDDLAQRARHASRS